MTREEYAFIPIEWITTWINWFRDEYDTTYAVIARRTGIRYGTLTAWASGTNRPQWATYRKLFVLASRPYKEK